MKQNKRKHFYLYCGILFLGWIGYLPSSTAATFIEDPEIQHFILKNIHDLFKDPKTIPPHLNIQLILDQNPNAFVTFGNTLYIHTGLIASTARIEGLLSIIAHELGHIHGSHVSQGYYKIEQMQTLSLLSLLTGSLVGAFYPEAGLAVTATGLGLATENYFSYSRSQEHQADTFAIKLLKNNNISLQGMADFFNYLQKHSNTEYVSTHPLSKDRYINIKNALAQQKNTLELKQPQQTLLRMQAKIKAYHLEELPETIHTSSDPLDLYTHAIFLYKKSLYQQALIILKKFIHKFPQDLFYQEFYARNLLLASSNNDPMHKGIAIYEKFLNQLPPALQKNYGVLLIKKTPYKKKGSQILAMSLEKEPNNPLEWHTLGQIYSDLQQQGESFYALGNYFLYSNNLTQAKQSFQKSIAILPLHHPYALKSIDLLQQLHRHETDN